jgi:hypothetical protein
MWRLDVFFFRCAEKVEDWKLSPFAELHQIEIVSTISSGLPAKLASKSTGHSSGE